MLIRKMWNKLFGEVPLSNKAYWLMSQETSFGESPDEDKIEEKPKGTIVTFNGRTYRLYKYWGKL